MVTGIRSGSWLGGPLLLGKDPEAWQWYRLSRAAAVLPKIDTREPVRLDRQSPLDETCQPQRLHPCSVHLHSTRLSSRFSLPGRPDTSQPRLVPCA